MAAAHINFKETMTSTVFGCNCVDVMSNLKTDGHKNL